MSDAMAAWAAPADTEEYPRPRIWRVDFGREQTQTTVSREVTPTRALMEALADSVAWDGVLDWASSREDMPEYADTPEAEAERTEFYVAVSPSLLESIERRSGG